MIWWCSQTIGLHSCCRTVWRALVQTCLRKLNDSKLYNQIPHSPRITKGCSRYMHNAHTLLKKSSIWSFTERKHVAVCVLMLGGEWFSVWIFVWVRERMCPNVLMRFCVRFIYLSNWKQHAVPVFVEKLLCKRLLLRLTARDTFFLCYLHVINHNCWQIRFMFTCTCSDC